MSARHCVVASFNDRHIGVECRTEWLASELRRRLMHLVAAPGPPPSVILRVTLDELEVSWIEVRDSTGRCERGSFEYAVYHVRKWMTTAFVAAHPDLIWLHASAASTDGTAVLFAGPAGAGKSTLLVQLVNRGWELLADDAVALRPDRGEALPLPFTPEVRAEPRGLEQDWPEFLERPKALATIAPDRIASTPAAVAAIVFPEYRPGRHPPGHHAADRCVGGAGAGDAGARCPPCRRKHRRAVLPGPADSLLPAALCRPGGRGG